ncbi:MAG: glycoside hydrolase family 27 protein [Firmicutes bacterium]|nr:glycoside hydrolase family 27 protein [Bacillota bacterium]
MVALTPPLGWNSWNTFGEDINETVVMQSADTLIDSGLAACGYNYIVIDDCWALKERGEDGRMVPDPVKFPHGMKYVADYIHSKGLKFGMYSCAGAHTCAGYPGSFDHEFIDAKTFAEWGVDYLKYDYCFHPFTIAGNVLYKRMAVALANSGRDILFSACSWGADETKKWIKETGANMWRTTGDINDSWRSIRELSLVAGDAIKHGSINCFPDMDMLVTGMNGKGNVGFAGCTPEEYRTHFSLWALLGSPLMIGCDIRSMDDATRETLMNKDVLAINQDPAYNQAFDASANAAKEENEYPIYVRLLDNGDYAIGLFNFSDVASSRWSTYLLMDTIGLPETTGKTLLLKELWTGEERKVTNGILTDAIPPHGCKLYRAQVVDR